MKSILEKALVHLLNEETEKAQELMHQFVVERARSIHESLREGDEADMDAVDDATLEEEEFFTEADLDDAEAVDQLEDDLDDNDGAEADAGADAPMGDMDGAELPVVADDAEGEADMGADFGGEEAGEPEDMDAKLDNISDEIQSLQAEFDKIMAEFEGGSDEDEVAGDDVAVADDTTVADASTGDEEFDDITESMVDDLKKVTTPNADGMGATGGKLTTPTVSPIAKDAKPRVLASKNTVGHTGFDRESAPSKKDGKKYDNVRSKGTDGNAPVPATGPKAATLNKPVAGNNKSIIPGTKKK